MPDYQKLYYELFNSITDWMEQLKQFQAEAEERYLNECGEDEGGSASD